MLVENLGPNWRDHFTSFSMIPFAAASIGQVHQAILSPDSPLAALYPASPNSRSYQKQQGLKLAIKIQFPGVRSSIKSDLSNLKWLLHASAILPPGLFLDSTLKVLEKELDEECDYLREADCGIKMRELLSGKGGEGFEVPRVLKELSGKMVLTTEMMDGEPFTEAIHYDQKTRDKVRFFFPVEDFP